MFAYISTESGHWRQAIRRVVNDQQAIYFKMVDDEGDAEDLSGAEDGATVSCVYQNGDIIFADKACVDSTPASGIMSYTPTAVEIAAMFRPGLYRFILKTTIDAVEEQSVNLLRLYLHDD